jgi:Folylpolyglutamate synthase
MLSDKNVRDFLSNIKDVVLHIFITTTPNSYSRAMDVMDLYACAREFFPPEKISIEEDPRRAYFRAKVYASNTPLVVTGSLYLVGFVRTLENIFTFTTN